MNPKRRPSLELEMMELRLGLNQELRIAQSLEVNWNLRMKTNVTVEVFVHDSLVDRVS